MTTATDRGSVPQNILRVRMSVSASWTTLCAKKYRNGSEHCDYIFLTEERYFCVLEQNQSLYHLAYGSQFFQKLGQITQPLPHFPITEMGQ